MFVTPLTGGRCKARRVALVGAGVAAEANAERWRRIAATCGYVARRRSAESVGWLVRGAADAIAVAQHTADGLSAAEFDGGTYKQDMEGAGRYAKRFLIFAPGAEWRRGR